MTKAGWIVALLMAELSPFPPQIPVAEFGQALPQSDRR
jgi:hypothetical protein